MNLSLYILSFRINKFLPMCMNKLAARRCRLQKIILFWI